MDHWMAHWIDHWWTDSLCQGPGSSKSGLVQVFDTVHEWSCVDRAGHGYEQPIFTSCRIDLNG
jgi:hypothetical protein